MSDQGKSFDATLKSATPPGSNESAARNERADASPQFTVRAIVIGVVLGACIAVSNLYLLLKIGWTFSGAITACVLSFAFWNVVRAASGGLLPPLTALENNIMQTTASAAGYATGGAIAISLGVVLLETNVHAAWPNVLLLALLTALLGVCFAIPLKRQMIDRERLPFPSGAATAETLLSLHRRTHEAIRQARALLTALAFGAAIALLRAPEAVIAAFDKVPAYLAPLGRIPAWLRIPESIAIPYPGALLGAPGRRLGEFSFEPNAFFIGAGMLVGPRIAFSMLLGAAIMYFGVGPVLVRGDEAGAANDASIPSVPGGDGIYLIRAWSQWPGTAILLAASLTGLALQWRMVVRSFRGLGGASGAATGSSAPRHHEEVSIVWLWIGAPVIGAALVVVMYMTFGISPGLGVLAVFLGFAVAVMACRITGETDTTPQGPLGKVAQALYSRIAPGNIGTNVVAAGVTTAAGCSSADLLTDLKSGHVLGASPRKQFLAQIIGCCCGAVVFAWAWFKLVPSAEALDEMGAPAVEVWRRVAQTLQGLESLPSTARIAMAIAATAGVALPLLAAAAPRAAAYLPSPIGLGFAWVVPFQNTVGFALGGLVALLWSLRARTGSGAYQTSVASGLVAGDSFVTALLAILLAMAAVTGGSG